MKYLLVYLGLFLIFLNSKSQISYYYASYFPTEVFTFPMYHEINYNKNIFYKTGVKRLSHYYLDEKLNEVEFDSIGNIIKIISYGKKNDTIFYFDYQYLNGRISKEFVIEKVEGLIFNNQTPSPVTKIVSYIRYYKYRKNKLVSIDLYYRIKDSVQQSYNVTKIKNDKNKIFAIKHLKRTSKYKYYKNGLMKSKKNEWNLNLSYIYDENNRLIQIIQKKYAPTLITFEYKQNMIINESHFFGEKNLTLEIKYKYNDSELIIEKMSYYSDGTARSEYYKYDYY